MKTPNPVPTAVAICKRLQVVALAMMAAQLLSLVLGWIVTHRHPDSSSQVGSHNRLMITIGFAIGIGLIAVSGLAIRRPATSVAQFGNLFFVSFVFAEIGVMIGLLLCFLFGKIAPLLLLAPAAAACIYANYLSIARRFLESRDLNPPQ